MFFAFVAFIIHFIAVKYNNPPCKCIIMYLRNFNEYDCDNAYELFYERGSRPWQGVIRAIWVHVRYSWCHITSLSPIKKTLHAGEDNVRLVKMSFLSVDNKKLFKKKNVFVVALEKWNDKRGETHFWMYFSLMLLVCEQKQHLPTHWCFFPPRYP